MFPDSSHKKRRSGGAKSYRQLVNDPAKLAYHLMDKSNKLHSAHVQQTKSTNKMTQLLIHVRKVIIENSLLYMPSNLHFDF